MKIIAIVQARMGSTRLPGKVMRTINGKPLIEILLSRLALSKKIHEVVLATSENENNKILVDYVQNLGFNTFIGSEDNVLERYWKCAKNLNADTIIRITGDCPLIDGELVDNIINQYILMGCDYLSNTNPPTFPDGLDTEIFSMKILEIAYQKANLTFDKEHVTPYMRNTNEFTTSNYFNSEDFSFLRWTVDEIVDLELVNNIFKELSPDIHFSWEKVIELYKLNPNKFNANNHILRNEGSNMQKGQKLWKRAKEVIPGGNMLLSKRAEMFLPEQWPTYFTKSKGCKVWDLDGNQFIDMSLMGVGTNILGYGHPEVDEAVITNINNGNMSTLNCPEEVYLAEKLTSIHSWADMVRFARTGGEANSISVRIARAATGKDNIAVCGYHGWHDWYLSANLGNDKILSGHLLPGLQPNGVPGNLRGTIFTFTYNDINELEDLIKNNNIGTIKMEVSRNLGPTDDFLHKVRKLATDNSIVLIFDECTSGFRQTYGGLHKLYGVEPDMAIFGKALGNGYAITAVIGRREVMEAAQTTFISSTFWTERIGPTAALKTLEVMENIKSWEIITDKGNKIRNGWQALSEKHDLPIEHWGLPSLAGFTFKSGNALAYKSIITQEMLSKGYLAGTSTYTCIDHTDEIIDCYFSLLDPIFKLIKDCEEGLDINKVLKGPVCHSGFKRLN